MNPIAYTYEARIEAARKIGREHGENAASWYFDGNTETETYRHVLAALDAGDPAVYDTFPTSPLSGEWADSYALRDLAEALDTSQDDPAFDSDYVPAYEDAFNEAVAETIEAAARRALA